MLGAFMNRLKNEQISMYTQHVYEPDNSYEYVRFQCAFPVRVVGRACVVIKKIQKITSIKTNFFENVMNIQMDLK